MSVHAFDQVETLLGAGSLGLELEEQAPTLDCLLVAVGGGGLIGGIAAWFAGSDPKTRVIGVEPDGAPTLTRARAEGRGLEAEGVVDDRPLDERLEPVVHLEEGRAEG